MQELLALATLTQYNLRILHWKTSTATFDCNHDLMSCYICKFDKFIDKFAEIGLMLGEDPVSFSKIPTTLDGKGILLDTTKSYNPTETFKTVDILFKEMRDSIREKAKDSKLTDAIKGELGCIDFWLSMEIDYKNKQRLK